MVRVKGSKGKKPNVEIKGLAESKRFLNQKGKDIENALEGEVFRNANFLQQEVQESIVGNRAEPKSVDSGKFANSISLDKLGPLTFKIYPQRRTYTGGTTTSDVAVLLEFGTTKIQPRRHFRNSTARNKPKIVKNIKSAINRAI